jgi:hypothetical protein
VEAIELKRLPARSMGQAGFLTSGGGMKVSRCRTLRQVSGNLTDLLTSLVWDRHADCLFEAPEVGLEIGGAKALTECKITVRKLVGGRHAQKAHD